MTTDTIDGRSRPPLSLLLLLRHLALWFLATHALLITGALIGISKPLMKNFVLGFFFLNALYITLQVFNYYNSIWRSGSYLILLILTGLGILWSLQRTAWGDPSTTETELRALAESIPDLPGLGVDTVKGKLPVTYIESAGRVVAGSAPSSFHETSGSSPSAPAVSSSPASRMPGPLMGGVQEKNIQSGVRETVPQGGTHRTSSGTSASSPAAASSHGPIGGSAPVVPGLGSPPGSRDSTPPTRGQANAQSAGGQSSTAVQEGTSQLSASPVEVIANERNGDGWRITLRNNSGDPLRDIRYELSYFTVDGGPAGLQVQSHILEEIGPHEAQTMTVDDHLVPHEASYAQVHIVSWQIQGD